ncbi:relA-associated inhibitor isoform X1 [Cyclopterus lumpus]|nr:relA-associated inhibitor isoform X1 [Cyclopterus lumpus]XP_034405222.1 relA-associated inhibitor isoform X1 [Cyclopterus lumpus]XP_034405223.1 relA-associated inhibitor isoform X1 [Cyclopterus lumpus]XP_034405224.1 relA-associated inhibitor isoform X1 [Cyclopterus lumpus]
MTSQGSFGSSMLFQTINDDLNASMATADELSKEFNSLLKEASSDNNSKSQSSSAIVREKPQSIPSFTRTETRGSSNGSSKLLSSSSTTFHPVDSVFFSNTSAPSPPPVFTTSPLSSPKIKGELRSPLPRAGSDSYSFGQSSPKHSPHTPRRNSPSQYDRSPRGSIGYADRSPSPSPTAASSDQQPWSASLHSSNLSPYDSSQMGRRSPRPDRGRSPLSLNAHMSNTLPRNFAAFRKPEEGVQQQQKSSSKWNETDLDMSYEKKQHHTYDKTEWLRPSVPSSSWRESNLDGPPLAPSPKKDSRSQSHLYSHASLPRNTRIAVPPDVSSPVHSPYHPQPILSRISIPPTSTQSRQYNPIPLSVIMRLQNPRWGARSTLHPRGLGGEGDMAPYLPPAPFPREFFHQYVPQPLQHPPELRQPAVYSDALNSGDIDAELERLDLVHPMPVISENPNIPEGKAPRPLSPTRLQPVVAPEAQGQEIPHLEELLRMRAEIPRALKRRGSVDQSQPLKSASHYQPNQYKNLIDKLFRRKGHRQRGEQGSESSSSSEEEEAAMPPAPLPAPTMHPEFRSYHSILRQSKQKSSGRRARLSPLVLLLDGALVGELEIVQKAVQEMNDPSQPNDEGITALHNAICGGHYNVVDFLVRIGANVSAPDSHGWTPLHCSASCNDRQLCEFLVRNGAAVVAMTQSDGATASQKCDPYAVGFEECENFLKGVEEAMGVENSGVLYALWSYPAQAADELTFKEGDMVTILQKPEGSDWWWASLCGREGFVPNNYFGLFPKVRPKSLC